MSSIDVVLAQDYAEPPSRRHPNHAATLWLDDPSIRRSWVSSGRCPPVALSSIMTGNWQREPSASMSGAVKRIRWQETERKSKARVYDWSAKETLRGQGHDL